MMKKIEKNNLLRILRPDKTQILLTLSAMQDFLSQEHVEVNNPLYRDLATPKETLKSRVENVISNIANPKLQLNCVESKGQIGSGAIPSEHIKSYAMTCSVKGLSAQKLAQKLRLNELPIVPRIENNVVFLDFLTIRETEILAIENFFKALVIAK